FDGTQAGIRMKAARGSGGLVENVTYENLTMKNVKVAILITSFYPKIPKDVDREDRKSTRLNSSHVSISYAVFCLKKKKKVTENLWWSKGYSGGARRGLGATAERAFSAKGACAPAWGPDHSGLRTAAALSPDRQ